MKNLFRQPKPSLLIKWRQGEGMNQEIDVRKISGNKIVIHFGGNLHSVDAYTFASSLIAFADTVRAVNEIINPAQKIDVRLQAVGEGSFRAVVESTKRGLKGLFSDTPKNIFWIVVTLVIEAQFDNKQKPKIIVNDDSVVIISEGQKIIVPRNDYELLKNVKKSEKVQQGIRETFKAVERDEAIRNFGLTPNLDDEYPLIQIPRKNFEHLSSLPSVVAEEDKQRIRSEEVSLVVLKPWIDASNNKWSFEWNGHPISANIKDEIFLKKVQNNQIRFGNGDIVKAIMKFRQNYDDRGVWINDNNTFSIVEVIEFSPKTSEPNLYDHL